MIKQFVYLIRVLVFSLIFMLFAQSLLAEKVHSFQAGSTFTNALFPGFVRPDSLNLISGIADFRRVADPRFTLKPVGADVQGNSWLDEPAVVDNLFRLRY